MEEKLIKLKPIEVSFSKSDLESIKPKQNNAMASTMDCKSQIQSKVLSGVFEIVMAEMSDRKSKFGLLKIFRIGKAIIKLFEEVYILKQECKD